MKVKITTVVKLENEIEADKDTYPDFDWEGFNPQDTYSRHQLKDHIAEIEDAQMAEVVPDMISEGDYLDSDIQVDILDD